MKHIFFLLLTAWLAQSAAFAATPSPAAFIQRLKAGEKVTIVTMGTSLTGGQWRWPDVMLNEWLHKDFPGQVRLINEGVGASASSVGPGNNEALSGIGKLPAVLAHQPDVVFIEFSINDAYLPYKITQDDSKRNLNTLIDRIIAANPKTEIIIQTMNPVKSRPEHGGDAATQRPRLADYVEGYRQVAKARALRLVDHYPNWLRLMQDKPAEFDKLVPDGIHPQTAGYRTVLLPELKRILMPPPATRQPNVRNPAANGMTVCWLAQTGAAQGVNMVLPAPAAIKAYDIDFNWGPGGPNAFAKPGLWADADPAAHVAWYKAIGCNVIQSFCVSCNGYAWYKDGVVPEQPGLKHDFLPEMVKLAHQEKLLVFGYFCAGANTRWGQTRPGLSYGFPNEPHIPYTDEYLAYLDAAIRDAVMKTGMDGFMLDWLRMPTNRASNGNRWLDCEKKLYTQLMAAPFPGEDSITPAQMTAYGRKAVDRAWQTIRKAAKDTNPKCLVWLTCCDVNDPHISDSSALKETDWLLNEAGDVKRTADAKRMIGPQTRLITCLAEWNRQDPSAIVPDAVKNHTGLYGFTKPTVGNLKPPASFYLQKPATSFSGDDRNIAFLARAYLGLAEDYVEVSTPPRDQQPGLPTGGAGAWEFHWKAPAYELMGGQIADRITKVLPAKP